MRVAGSGAGSCGQGEYHPAEGVAAAEAQRAESQAAKDDPIACARGGALPADVACRPGTRFVTPCSGTSPADGRTAQKAAAASSGSDAAVTGRVSGLPKSSSSAPAGGSCGDPRAAQDQAGLSEGALE